MNLCKCGFSKITTSILPVLVIVLFFMSNYRQLIAEERAAKSSEAAAGEYQTNWWRSVRKDMWTWEGGQWSAIESALDRIKAATGERRYPDKYDTIIKYGPGHWVYEWSHIGNEAHKEAFQHQQNGNKLAARQSFLQASIYYTQASYPHFRDKYSRAALTKAFEMYRKAGQYFSVAMEQWEFEVDGAKFKAFIHFPKIKSTNPLPVILKTGGMDVLSTEFYPLSIVINNYGAAMIVYDSPGTGNDGIVDGKYDKHHVAVLKRVLKDPRFDAKRIAIWSESLAGLTAVRIALGEYRNNIAAAVNSCGPIHALYAMELTGGTPAEYNLHKMLQSYNNGELSKQQINKFNEAMLNPHLEGMLVDFQGATFVDRVRADSNNLLDILSKSVPVSLIEQGLLNKKNITATPLLTINTHSDPLVPLSESQLVTDASSQGKLMIFDEYEGHCVSREEIPTIMKWLSYHLGLNSYQPVK